MFRAKRATGALFVLAVVICGCQRSKPPAPPQNHNPVEPLSVSPRGDAKTGNPNLETLEITEYHTPSAQPEDPLTDDDLATKNAPFDPTLVDRRVEKGWLVNLSDAVLRLDVPIIHPDYESSFLTLYPSYTAACKSSGYTILPSVNMIDGAAKQFDDGLYAALDEAYYKGLEGRLASHVAVIRRLLDKLDPASPAWPFLAAALELAGHKVPVSDEAGKNNWLADFRADELRSKPIAFYTWSETLSADFRFLRFLARRFDIDKSVPQALAKALGDDAKLSADLKSAVAFYAKLTNPPAYASIVDYAGKRVPSDSSFVISLFPPATSVENELFMSLFPGGLPPNVDLMRELIRRIKSGEVDLKPKPDSGWYAYQVHGLETLLLPEKGPENAKLLLTRAYKKRMLEAFQALIAKRRETHARVLPPAEVKSAEPPPLPPSIQLGPRLRLEPCPTFYLRTARAYAFLESFLVATLGEPAFAKLHGLREDKPQETDLLTELRAIRGRFYGLYLLSCEDIGQRPAFLEGESVDQAHCEELASTWLKGFESDSDLARDARVAVPIFIDFVNHKTRLWVTLGVRLSRLEVAYVRPPRIKPAEGPGDWKPLNPDQLFGLGTVIAVDEFAEVEVNGLRVPDRAELRSLCNAYNTKHRIIEALQQGKW
jgi:hypothetical protein